MKNLFKRTMLISIFSLVTLNVGTTQPASPSSIASRLKVTGQQWMNALQQYSPHMTPQQKQRLITLTKRTSKLIAAFLVVLGLYAIGKRRRRRDEGIPKEIVKPVLEGEEKVVGDAPAEGEREGERIDVEELFKSVRPEEKTLTLQEMMDRQRRAREEATTGHRRAYSQ